MVSLYSNDLSIAYQYQYPREKDRILENRSIVKIGIRTKFSYNIFSDNRLTLKKICWPRKLLKY